MPQSSANKLKTGAVKIFTLPIASFTHGNRSGPYPGPPMGAVYSAFQFSVACGPHWPTSGGPVLGIIVERSVDGGVNWIFRASTYHWDTTQQSDFNWFVPMVVLMPRSPEEQLDSAATDIYRVTFDCIQDCDGVIDFYGVP